MTDTQTALAEAWDEGWDACLGAVKVTRAAQLTRGVSFADPDNPYRSKSRKGRGAICSTTCGACAPSSRRPASV